MACLTLPGLWLQQELERTSSHWISTDLHPLLSLNRSTHTPPPLTPSHSQAHIAKQLASKREAGEGYLFLASSLRGPQGAGNLLASSDQPSEQALPLRAHPGSQTTLPAQRLQDALLPGLFLARSPLPTSPKQSVAEGNAASRTERIAALLPWNCLSRSLWLVSH